MEKLPEYPGVGLQQGSTSGRLPGYSIIIIEIYRHPPSLWSQKGSLILKVPYRKCVLARSGSVDGGRRVGTTVALTLLLTGLAPVEASQTSIRRPGLVSFRGSGQQSQLCLVQSASSMLA